MNAFTTTLTRTQCRDAGLAFVFILLLLEIFGVQGPWRSWVPLTAVAVLTLMTVPRVFKPFGVFWFGLSTVMGAVMSRVLLSVLFFVIVTPVGLMRRILGADSMRLKEWKSGTGSVFTVRDHQVVSSDLENLF